MEVTTPICVIIYLATTAKFLYPTGKTYLFHRKPYVVRVNGTLICGKEPLAGAFVQIWSERLDIETDKPSKDLLAETYTDFNGYYTLEATEYVVDDVKPTLQILHNCNQELKKISQECKLKTIATINCDFIDSHRVDLDISKDMQGMKAVEECNHKVDIPGVGELFNTVIQKELWHKAICYWKCNKDNSMCYYNFTEMGKYISDANEQRDLESDPPLPGEDVTSILCCKVEEVGSQIPYVFNITGSDYED